MKLLHCLLVARCRAFLLAVLCAGLWAGTPSYAGPTEVSFLQALEGQWSGQGRAATSDGETPVLCEIDSQLRGAARLSMRANCQAQGRSSTIALSLYFSDMTQQFHGELLSPLNHISGGLNGRLARGDLFLRLSAEDGSEGRLLLVAEGPSRVRLLVTTIVNGANITVFDLPLAKLS